MKIKYILISIMALALAVGCKSNEHDGHDHDEHAKTEGDAHGKHSHDEHEHEHEHDDEHKEEKEHDHDSEFFAYGEEIILSAKQAAAAGVKTTLIEPVAFRQAIRTSGRIMAAQGSEQTVVAPISGIIHFGRPLTEGMPVNKGQSLISISTTGINQADPEREAKISYDLAKSEYERLKPLADEKIVSARDLAAVTEAYEQAKLRYEAVSRYRSTGGQQVVSGISGYIKNVMISEGDYVEMGQPLVGVTQNKQLMLRAEISERYYPHLSTIRSANFKTPYADELFELDSLSGRLLSIGKSSADDSFFIPITFSFDNKGDIIPGSFVEVFLLFAPKEGIIALPREALMEEQGSYFVYKKIDAEGYVKHKVTLGQDNGRYVEILDGVKVGEHVVTKGAYTVKLSSASLSIPGHAH